VKEAIPAVTTTLYQQPTPYSARNCGSLMRQTWFSRGGHYKQCLLESDAMKFVSQHILIRRWYTFHKLHSVTLQTTTKFKVTTIYDTTIYVTRPLCNSVGAPWHSFEWRVMVKSKVKVIQEQVIKVQRGSRGIALLFLQSRR